MSAAAIAKYAEEIKAGQRPQPVGPCTAIEWIGGVARPVNPNGILGFYQRSLAEADAVIQHLTHPTRHVENTDYLVLLSQWQEDSNDRWRRYPTGK